MKHINITYSFWGILLIIIFPYSLLAISCNKFLDKKSQMSFYVPDRAQDLQALLDNNEAMNFYSALALPELLAGDFYVSNSRWNAASAFEKFHYVWSADAQNAEGWSVPYQNNIYISNVVLDQIGLLSGKENKAEVNSIQGSALFYRSLAFYNLAQLYCLPYNSSSASTDLGIVLRQTAAVDVNLQRSSVSDTYNQIIKDLLSSCNLLPESTTTLMRPSKIAAYALLARVYLSMRDYDNAGKYADMALQKKNEILDFNSLPTSGNSFLPNFSVNPEIIFFYRFKSLDLSHEAIARVSFPLYDSYDSDDLRKNVFFRINEYSATLSYRYIGSYFSDNPSTFFNGLTTSELHFIKMECLTRQGKYEEGISKLNNFLENRYKSGVSKKYHAGNKEEALGIILEERHKELAFRGLRWTDIRRLNLDGANITLERIIGEAHYVLPPNDLRYALLIPEDEIIRAGIKQNLR